jgi:hypothetical protein
MLDDVVLSGGGGVMFAHGGSGQKEP